MIRIAIVEDNRLFIETLNEYIGRFKREMNCDIETVVFRDGEDITEDYSADYDIILMDIQMEFMDGIQAARLIREKDSRVIIMFITNMSNYAIKGYEVDALDYILKPIDYYMLSQKLSRAIERIRKTDEHYVLISVEEGFQKVEVSRIYYIESRSHDMIYHTKDGVFTSRGKMEELEKLMSPYGFFRSNKGYLVNMRRVDKIQDGCCLVGGDLLPVSRRKKTEFLECLSRML